MILYLIRHGEPDYTTDTLTETGRKQAEKAAARLIVSGIDEIHSSPMGRARETAQITAEKSGLSIQIEDWAEELGEESKTTYPDGVSKTISLLTPEYLHQEKNLKYGVEEGLHCIPGLNDSGFRDRYHQIAAGLDVMLEKTGYRRNRSGMYDVLKATERHVALFCHGGMMRVLLSHLLNIPYPILGATALSHFTGITVLCFDSEGPVCSPRLFSFGDIGHLYADGEKQVHYWIPKQF